MGMLAHITTGYWCIRQPTFMVGDVFCGLTRGWIQVLLHVPYHAGYNTRSQVYISAGIHCVGGVDSSHAGMSLVMLSMSS
jgi:hypothetical protein